MLPPAIWEVLFGGKENMGELLYHLKLPNKHLYFTYHFASCLKISAYEAKNLSKEMHQTKEA